MALTKPMAGSVVQGTTDLLAAGTTIGENVTESASMELVVVKIGGLTLPHLVGDAIAANARFGNRFGNRVWKYRRPEILKYSANLY